MTFRFVASSLVGLTLAASLIGCGEKEEVADGAPPTQPFTGKVDPAFSGTWKMKDGKSSLELKETGALVIDTKFNTPKGEGTSHSEGQWLVDGERLRMKYRTGDGPETTLSYSHKLEGDKLTLSTKTPKLDNVYLRQK